MLVSKTVIYESKRLVFRNSASLVLELSSSATYY
jgi:hypothetical protein